MQPVRYEGKEYFAEGARRSEGVYPYTCTAFTRHKKEMYPVRTQKKLYELAMLLRGAGKR